MLLGDSRNTTILDICHRGMSKHYKLSEVVTSMSSKPQSQFLFGPELFLSIHFLSLSIPLHIISNAAPPALPPELLSGFTNFLFGTIISDQKSSDVFLSRSGLPAS